MKSLKLFRGGVFLLVLLSLGACKKDGGDTAVVFPNAQTITVEANSTQTLTFSINASWVLSSDATWCLFDGRQSAVGEAGNANVTATITDADQDLFENTTATITLTADNRTEDVFYIVRAPSGVQSTVTDAQGNEVTEVAAGWHDYVSYTFTANFDFTISCDAAWLETDGTLSGTSGVGATVGFKAVDDASYYKYPQTGTITLANADGTASATCALTFAGMDADAIEISTEVKGTVWTVTTDGETFRYGSDDIDPTFTINALNDGYVIVVADDSDGWAYYVDSKYDASGKYADAAASWIGTTDDGKGSVTLTADALSSGSRSAYVLALPPEIYESLSSLEAVGGDGAVNADYEDYVLCSLSQTAPRDIIFELYVNQGDSENRLEVLGEYVSDYTDYPDLDKQLAKKYNTEYINCVTDFPIMTVYYVIPTPYVDYISSTNLTWASKAELYYADGTEVPTSVVQAAYGYWYNETSYDRRAGMRIGMFDSPGQPIYLLFQDDEGDYRILIICDK